LPGAAGGKRGDKREAYGGLGPCNRVKGERSPRSPSDIRN
jgi:hypothetical protein